MAIKGRSQLEGGLLAESAEGTEEAIEDAIIEDADEGIEDEADELIAEDEAATDDAERDFASGFISTLDKGCDAGLSAAKLKPVVLINIAKIHNRLAIDRANL